MNRIKFDREANKASLRHLSISVSKTFGSLVADDATALRLSGYFAVFNRLSTDRGGYLALIPPGSMVLPDYDVRALYNHNEDHILGRESNGSLTFSEDANGYAMSLSMTDTQYNRDLFAQVKSRDIKGMSMGMFPLKTRRETRVLTAADVDPDSGLTSLIGKSVDVEVYESWLLDEVTVTGNPAFPQTTLEGFARNKGTSKGLVERDLYELEAELLGLWID